MGSATALNQLFRNLCHHSMWKYAILWKFQDENHKLLTCEDSYALDTKSSIATEYAQNKEFISNHPWITSFGCESICQNGGIPSFSIAMAVFNMTRFSYVLGEGIVGKAATMVRHQWICIGDVNPELLLEYPEELGLQVAAGIKTVLLLPLLPLGLVQLGSLDKISEDLTMVALLKDSFCAYRYNLDSISTFELKIGQIDSYMALNRPPEKYSTCLEINTNLTCPIQTQPFFMPDLAAFSFDQVASVRLPHPMVQLQSNDPFTKVGFQQAHGLSADLLNEIRGNAIYCGLFQDQSEGNVLHNTCTLTERTMESDESSTPNEKELKSIPVISQELTFKNPVRFDASMKDLQHCNDFCDFKKDNIKFTGQFDVVINSTTDGRNLDFSVESLLHNVMEQNCLMGCNSSTWIANQSKANEGSEPICSFKEEVPETIGYLLEEPCVMDKEYLTWIAMEELRSVSDGKELESSECAKFLCSSSERCSDSRLSQCKTQDALISEDSGCESHKMSSLISDFEGFTSYFTCPQKSFVHMPPRNEDLENSIFGFWRSCLKESHYSSRQIKNSGPTRKRPRDRQLIQDRIRELRELIPNASKCSIDALLEQAVRHMMFLRSVPIHAHKLSQTTMSKVGDDDSKFHGTEVRENRGNYRSEVGTKLMPFPLVVENIDDQPDQMLVEMQCRNHGLFLDIAQAINRLGLTILKGILESRLEELWAYFIVEIPKGFHRMDIVWPLMQLLQLKF